jgi:hypothetical protein
VRPERVRDKSPLRELGDCDWDKSPLRELGDCDWDKSPLRKLGDCDVPHQVDKSQAPRGGWRGDAGWH